MNNRYREDNCCCYFHPKEVFVGVCPLCLNERLLILAAKQSRHHHLSSSARGFGRASSRRKTPGHGKKKPPINIPKIFALGSLLNRLELRQSKSDDSGDVPDASTSHEDSFISIKFGDNGVASWEKGTVSKVSLEHCGKKSWNNNSNLNQEINQPNKQKKEQSMSVMEHAKSRPSLLSWRKPIGHLFHLIRWKRSNKDHVEGVKGRKSWIRVTLTKRRTKE